MQLLNLALRVRPNERNFVSCESRSAAFGFIQKCESAHKRRRVARTGRRCKMSCVPVTQNDRNYALMPQFYRCDLSAEILKYDMNICISYTLVVC